MGNLHAEQAEARDKDTVEAHPGLPASSLAHAGAHLKVTEDFGGLTALLLGVRC